MAYAVIHHFPGGTRAQYEAVLAAVHPAGGLPVGQTYHAAGPSAGRLDDHRHPRLCGELGVVPRRHATAGARRRGRRRVYRPAGRDHLRDRHRDERIVRTGLRAATRTCR